MNIQIVSPGYKMAIELLIKKGAFVNAVTISKLTPLHYVAWHDSLNRNQKDWTGDDDLSNFNFACFKLLWLCQSTQLFLTQLEFAELLIDHGADLHAMDKNNKTPLDLATSEKCKAIEQYYN